MRKIKNLILTTLIVLNTLIQINAQSKEVKLDLNSDNVNKVSIIDLKSDGIIVSISTIDNWGAISKVAFQAYDKDLNHKWTITNDTLKFITWMGIDYYPSQEGYPLFVKMGKIDSEGEFSPIMSDFNSGEEEAYQRVVPTKENGVLLLTKDKSINDKKNNHYILRKYSSNSRMLLEKRFSISNKSNSKWKKSYFDGNQIFHHLNEFKHDKKYGKSKMTIDYISVNNKGDVVNTVLESSDFPINDFRTYSSMHYLFDNTSGNNFLSYINGNYFYIDCFDIKGNLKWTNKKQFSEDLILNKTHKNSYTELKVLDNQTIGFKLDIGKQKESIFYYISKETGKLIDKQTSNKTSKLIENFVITQNKGKIADYINHNYERTADKKTLKTAEYSYLDQGNRFLIILYSDNEIAISFIKK